MPTRVPLASITNRPAAINYSWYQTREYKIYPDHTDTRSFANVPENLLNQIPESLPFLLSVLKRMDKSLKEPAFTEPRAVINPPTLTDKILGHLKVINHWALGF